MIQVRPWDVNSDKIIIQRWYEGNGSMGPHPSQLPPLGMVAYNDEYEIAAVGAYQSIGVGVAFPEWLVTNPEVGPFTKVKGVVAAMTALERALSKQGYQMKRISIIDERIANLAEKLLDYADIGPKVTYMVKNTAE